MQHLPIRLIICFSHQLSDNPKVESFAKEVKKCLTDLRDPDAPVHQRLSNVSSTITLLKGGPEALAGAYSRPRGGPDVAAGTRADISGTQCTSICCV